VGPPSPYPSSETGVALPQIQLVRPWPLRLSRVLNLAAASFRAISSASEEYAKEGQGMSRQIKGSVGRMQLPTPSPKRAVAS